jgi:hypothetical protein
MIAVPYLVLAAVLIFAASAQQDEPRYAAKPQDGSIAVSANTILRVPETAGGSALQQILAIGRENHLPLGIVVPDRTLCSTRLTLSEREPSVQALLAEINQQFPTYRAELLDSTVNIEPRNLPAQDARLLDTRIDQFTSRSATHQGMGVHLWMFIRAVLVPGESTGFAGGSSTHAERLTGIHVEQQSVAQILNLIVRKGHGGLWAVRNLQPGWERSSPVLPYEIFAYSDEYSGFENFSCPAK